MRSCSDVASTELYINVHHFDWASNLYIAQPHCIDVTLSKDHCSLLLPLLCGGRDCVSINILGVEQADVTSD